MFLTNFLAEQTTSISMTPKLETKFKDIFDQIHDAVKEDLNANVTPKWLSGIMAQVRDFNALEKRIELIKNSSNDSEAIRELNAKIIARDILRTNFGFNDRYVPLKPKSWALFRQYLTTDVHDLASKNNLSAKQTGYLVRDVASDEYKEWYESLPPQNKTYVDNMEHVDSNTFSLFKRILALRNSKKRFMDVLGSINNDGFIEALNNMQILNNGKINSENLNSFFEFINSLTAPRLKDIINKNMVYSTKKHTHDRHIHKNEKLRASGVDVPARPDNTSERRAQKATTRNQTLKDFLNRSK